MIGLAKAELGQCTEAIKILAPEFMRPSDDDTGRLSGLHLLRCYSDVKQPDKALMTGKLFWRDTRPIRKFYISSRVFTPSVHRN